MKSERVLMAWASKELIKAHTRLTYRSSPEFLWAIEKANEHQHSSAVNFAFVDVPEILVTGNLFPFKLDEAVLQELHGVKPKLDFLPRGIRGEWSKVIKNLVTFLPGLRVCSIPGCSSTELSFGYASGDKEQEAQMLHLEKQGVRCSRYVAIPPQLTGLDTATWMKVCAWWESKAKAAVGAVDTAYGGNPPGSLLDNLTGQERKMVCKVTHGLARAAETD